MSVSIIRTETRDLMETLQKLQDTEDVIRDMEATVAENPNEAALALTLGSLRKRKAQLSEVLEAQCVECVRPGSSRRRSRVLLIEMAAIAATSLCAGALLRGVMARLLFR